MKEVKITGTIDNDKSDLKIVYFNLTTEESETVQKLFKWGWEIFRKDREKAMRILNIAERLERRQKNVKCND